MVSGSGNACECNRRYMPHPRTGRIHINRESQVQISTHQKHSLPELSALRHAIKVMVGTAIEHCCLMLDTRVAFRYNWRERHDARLDGDWEK